ncbi:hypothetical protein ACFX1X_010046 [Malus domestica]
MQGGKAAAIVNRMLQKKELPKLSERFARITCCQSESDVQSSVDAYSGFGPLDTLPNGYFGQKNPGAKIQLGSLSEKSGKEKEGEELVVGSVGGDGSLNDASTLAFPSISTADFQFDLAKASDIIVEKVIEFRNKLGNSRLVLVDLSH